MSLDNKKNNSRSQPGLLGRAVSIRNRNFFSLPGDNSNPNIEEFDEIHSDDFSLNDFYNSLSELNDGLELPSRLFRLLAEKTGIISGAFLLVDDSGDFFVHSSSTGVDKTTVHRLKVSRDFLKNLPEAFKNPVILHNDEILYFKPYLSMRLFDSADEIILFPLYSGEVLLAIIIILDYEDSENNMLNILERVNNYVSNILIRSKFLNLNRNYSSSIPSREILLSELENKIEAALIRKEKLSVILLDLSNILDFLSEKAPDLDIFRAKNDISTILNNMVEGIGDVKYVDSTRLLIIISSKTTIKDLMLLNQVRLSLQSFFQHKDDFPQLHAHVKRVPDDGMDANTLLEDLI